MTADWSMPKLSLSDLDPSGQRLFMRVDFNVPMSDGEITDDARIRASLPSIRYVVNNGGSLVLASHLGRPKGKVVPALSLGPVAKCLGELLSRDVALAPDSVGDEVAAMIAGLTPGDILLLENLRFHPGEQANDPEFARRLARGIDVYVNDAFGAAHRAHASTSGICSLVDRAAAGFLMQKELDALSRILKRAQSPYVSIIGGAKISGKLELIESLLETADDILVGGAMAYTFFRAEGLEIGRSLVEEDRVDIARQLLETARARKRRIRLPVDHVVARDLDGTGRRTIPVSETAPEEMGLDIGPETVSHYGESIGSARTVVWNGPMGVFENPKFREGTLAVARAVAESDAFSLVGGGDSAAAVHQAGFEGSIDHVSTGGGAALEYLCGRKLPGIEALTDRPVD